MFRFIFTVGEMNIYFDMKQWVWHNNFYPTLHQFKTNLDFTTIKCQCLKYEQEGVVTRKIQAEVEYKYEYSRPFFKK